MHAPASRRQPSARSRMLSSVGPARAGRGLGDVVTGIVHGVSDVVHDASHVAHDVGHAVGDVLSGKFSKVPDDIVKTGLDVVKTGKHAIDVVSGALDPSGTHNPGNQSHSGGGEGGAQPRPPPAPGSGGGEGTVLQPSRPSSTQAQASTSPPAPSASPSSEYTVPASSAAYNTVAGATNVASDPSYVRPPPESMDPPAQGDPGPTYGKAMDGMPPAPSSAASSTQSPTTTGGALPSNGSGATHRKGFPLAAAAALGAVLGFLVVSALFWAVWLYLRKRRLHAVYLPPKRMLSVTSGRTVSTVPLFISASEAGVKDDLNSNPFRHPLDKDEEEGDPFDAASLWRSSTTRSASTLSV